MSLNSDALAFLAEKGFTVADIVEFARLSERKADPTNAERQARYRERRKERKCEAVTRDSNGVIPPIERIHTPSSVSNETVKTNGRAIAQKLPDDWQPVLTASAQRIVDGWPPGRFEQELAAFRDYAADKGRTSKDWQAAFRTWLTNAERWTKNDRSKTIQPGNGHSPDRRSTLARAIDEGIDWLGGSQAQVS